MPRTILTDARVRALKPRKTVRDVRDARLKGFGVRVSPSGRKQFFIQCQHRGERIWKIAGDAETVSVGEARSLAGGMLAAVRRGEGALHAPGETLFEAVAETTFRRHERLWKAGTLAVNRSYLRNQLLPYFAGRPIADIDRQEVRNWFARLRATPVAADRSMPVLSVIMREAERMGLRPEGSNPCRGIKRYRRKGRERFLSDDEIRGLSREARRARGPMAEAGRAHPPASADGLPQGRSFDAQMVRLPRRQPVPARQQDGAEDGLAVGAGPGRSG